MRASIFKVLSNSETPHASNALSKFNHNSISQRYNKKDLIITYQYGTYNLVKQL